MLQAKREHRFFIIAVSLYLLAVIGFSVYEYFNSKRILMVEVDQRLYRAAALADNFLLQEMRENIAGKKPLTFDEDFLLALKLQSLTESLSVEYIYSLKESFGNIFFLSSNMTPEEYANVSYQPVNLTLYDDAPQVVYTVFESGEPQFFEYRDRWGEFRSLFLPFTDQNQTPYVIGVDIDIREINLIAAKSVLKAIFYGLFLGFIVFPIIFLYVRLFRQFYDERIKAAESHPITNLPNKRCLVREIEKSDSETQHLLLIKIQNFHDISNLNGVTFGDELLLKIHYRLRAVSALGIEHCRFYHLDESLFGVYTQYPLGRKEQVAIVNRVFKDLSKMIIKSEDGQTIPLILKLSTASNQSNLYTLARMSLNYAVANDKTFVEYEPTLELPSYFQRHLSTYHALTESINNNQVTVFYQPIVDANTGKAVKYEALIRLLNPDADHTISTEEYMAVAYQTRICHKLARMVVDQVIEDMKSHDSIVTMNLSVKDLFDQATREYLIKKIRQNGVGDQLELELLEQQSITNYKRAAAYLKQLKSCVSAVGMDDLGKLYSNFDRLLELPLDFVKIDGALIESLVNNDESQAIVAGIVEFAERKDMRVIAEFCSSAEVCRQVREMKINLWQGYFICEPKPSIIEGDQVVNQQRWLDEPISG